jgi:hypothetical protein
LASFAFSVRNLSVPSLSLKKVAGGVGRGLLGNEVLVEAAALVVAVEVELRSGHQLVEPRVEAGKAGVILQLARLADHGDADLVEGLLHVGVLGVAGETLGAAHEDGIARDLSGHLDGERLRRELGRGPRLVGVVAAGGMLGVRRLHVDEELAGAELGNGEGALRVGDALRVLVAVGREVVLHGLVVFDVAPDLVRGRLAQPLHVRGGHEVDGGSAHGLLARVPDRAGDRLGVRGLPRREREGRRRDQGEPMGMSGDFHGLPPKNVNNAGFASRI